MIEKPEKGMEGKILKNLHHITFKYPWKVAFS
jgi:hypothetical protein